MFHPLSARLTVSFTLLFAVLALLVFGTAYSSLKRNLIRQIDTELHEDGLDFLRTFQQQGVDGLEASLRQEI